MGAETDADTEGEPVQAHKVKLIPAEVTPVSNGKGKEKEKEKETLGSPLLPVALQPTLKDPISTLDVGIRKLGEFSTMATPGSKDPSKLITPLSILSPSALPVPAFGH